MARTYDQLAKEHQGTQAASVYKYLANPGGGHGGAAFASSGDLMHNTTLLKLGHVQLITWGLSGNPAFLDALRAVQKKLPQGGKWPVLVTAAELAAMKKEAESVSTRLSKSARELERDFREYDAWQRKNPDPYYAEKKSANQKLIKDLQARSRSFDGEADQLFRGATAHDPNKRWDY